MILPPLVWVPETLLICFYEGSVVVRYGNATFRVTSFVSGILTRVMVLRCNTEERRYGISLSASRPQIEHSG